MAYSYQKSCFPGTTTILADLATTGGGASVTILNSHATEPLYLSGDENPGVNAGVAGSATTGLRLAAGQTFSTVLNGGEIIYGRSGTSTVTISAHVFRSNSRFQ